MLFDKLSNYKQVLFNSFADEIGDAVEFTIQLHNRSVDLLEYYVEEKFDLSDHWMEELPANYDAVYPDFSVDACEGVGYGYKKLRSYSELNVATLSEPLSIKRYLSADVPDGVFQVHAA